MGAKPYTHAHHVSKLGNFILFFFNLCNTMINYDFSNMKFKFSRTNSITSFQKPTQGKFLVMFLFFVE